MNEDKELSMAGKLGVLLAAILLVFVVLLLPLQLFSGRGSSEEKSVADKPRLTAEQAAALGNYQILYKDPEDKTGRTVVYEGRNTFDGAGTVVLETVNPNNSRMFNYTIVGKVVSINKIPESLDYQLTLENPLTGESLEIVRLVVEADDRRGGEQITWVALERLDNPGFDANEDMLYGIDKPEFEVVSKVLRPGDVIAVIPIAFDSNGSIGTLEDKEKRIFASLVVIRRFGRSL